MKSLYLVRCRGMQTAIGGSPGHGVAYVIAKDPGEAYRKLRDDLDKRDLGHARDRSLLTVELLAETHDYSDICKLYE